MEFREKVLEPGIMASSVSATFGLCEQFQAGH